jgi:DNA-binding NarL/FixJ family response regulator
MNNMRKKITLYHLDDHTLFVQGIFSLIGEEPEIQWLGSAQTAQEGIEEIIRLRPDVVLLDYFLPDKNGLEVAKELLSQNPEIRVLLLSMDNNPALINKCKKIGVLGFLPKTTDKKTLLETIKAVFEKKDLIAEFSEESLNKQVSDLALLSKREKEIAILITKGYTSAQISEKLFLSLLTVNTHRRNLINKLKLTNSAQLSSWMSKLAADDIF